MSADLVSADLVSNDLVSNDLVSNDMTTDSHAKTTDDFPSLYRRAFEEFGHSALWSSRPVANPTPADALAITQSLRVEGNLQARQLAEQIERACRATL